MSLWRLTATVMSSQTLVRPRLGFCTYRAGYDGLGDTVAPRWVGIRASLVGRLEVWIVPGRYSPHQRVFSSDA